MQHHSGANDPRLADTIRRTIRVLGAQPSPASNAGSVAAAARLVYERLQRARVPVQWVDDTPHAPLVVAGNGPTCIVTYLDDSHPDAIDQITVPPSFDEGAVRAPGIERKAGVVAALSTLLAFPDLSDDLTIIVETDRQTGSKAIESWLASARPDVTMVFWEIVDIPVLPPVIVKASTGRLSVQLQLRSSRQVVETVYGSVLPDIGFAIANTLASLKTSDEEVRLEGFYDGIISPDEAGFDALLAVAPDFTDWLIRVAGGERDLATSHMTLGIFCAPSVVVHDVRMTRNTPYLPDSASAIVEFQLMPGQTIQRTLDTLQSHVQNSPFASTITPLLARSPVAADDTIHVPSDIPTLPIAPGPSPAAMFTELGSQCLGYAVVGRRAAGGEDGVRLDSIVDGARFLLSLAESLGAREGMRHE